MKIDEKIEKLQFDLIRGLSKISTKDEEEIVRILEKLGLDKENATTLVKAFLDAQKKSQVAKETMNGAGNSTSSLEYSDDISKSQQEEEKSIQQYDQARYKCALILALEDISERDISDDILEKLYKIGIKEAEIKNPTLQVIYHYYLESQNLKKLKELVPQIAKQYKELEKEKNSLQDQNNNLEEENGRLKKLIGADRSKHKNEIMEMQRALNDALAQISTLRSENDELQRRSVFAVIRDKIKGFRNKNSNIKALPEGTAHSTKYLRENVVPKVETDKSVKKDKASTPRKTPTKPEGR